MNVLMVDGLVGNEYADCLCEALSTMGTELVLVVPENRWIREPVSFKVLRWAPTKGKERNRAAKIALYVRYQLKLLALALNGEYQIIHYQFFRRRADLWWFLAQKILGCRIVVTAHNVLPHENDRWDYLIKALVYRACDRIIVHSDYVRNRLLSIFPVKSSKIHVIRHGNFDHYLPADPIGKSRARVELGFDSSDHISLFFGYVRRYKGLDLLLDAFDLAASQNSSLKLLIAGAADTISMEDQCRQRIARSPHRSRIKCHFQFVPEDQVATYFQASDLVVLPYKAIDHSGLLHLAYSFGKAVIATAVGDFPECVKNGATGYLVEANALELASAILRAFQDPAALGRMGREAKSFSESEFSWNEAAFRTRILYDQLVS